MTTRLYYTGVGSRETPNVALMTMHQIAMYLSRQGYTLRTGDADGADRAFGNGAMMAGTPTCGNLINRYTASQATVRSMRLASQYHPVWEKLSEYAKKLHGRNAFQVLGPNLDNPSKFLLCWTPDGCESHATRNRSTGGTGTAISIAEAYGIPVINMKNDTWFRRYLEVQ